MVKDQVETLLLQHTVIVGDWESHCGNCNTAAFPGEPHEGLAQKECEGCSATWHFAALSPGAYQSEAYEDNVAVLARAGIHLPLIGVATWTGFVVIYPEALKMPSRPPAS